MEWSLLRGGYDYIQADIAVEPSWGGVFAVVMSKVAAITQKRGGVPDAESRWSLTTAS